MYRIIGTTREAKKKWCQLLILAHLVSLGMGILESLAAVHHSNGIVCE